jgi:hypothetical protein
VLWQRYYERTARRARSRRGSVCREATVKTRLRRALQRLRDELDRKYGGRRETWAMGLIAFARPPAALTPRRWIAREEAGPRGDARPSRLG